MDARFSRLECLPAPSPAEMAKADAAGVPIAAGEGAMRRLRDGLRRAGATAGPVDIWENHGWVFTFEEGGAKLSCMLQWGGEWLLMLWAHRSFADKLRGRSFAGELASGGARLQAACWAALGAHLPAFTDCPSKIRSAA